MLVTALVFLVIAALGGLYMASRIFKGEPPPKAVAVVHGLAVLVAVISLLVVLWDGSAGDSTIAAFVLALLTASGGIYLVNRHINHKPHPRMIVVMHGLLATATIITLAVAAF